jgi:flagellar protein FliS
MPRPTDPVSCKLVSPWMGGTVRDAPRAGTRTDVLAPGDETMKALEAYQQATVTTQSKGRLIVMLYDGAIKFLKLAIKELEAENYAAKGQYINRAQDIISELNAVLDMEVGGEIAANLRRLYMFMNRRLSQANAKRDAKMIQEVITLMDELNQGWKTIAG